MSNICLVIIHNYRENCRCIVYVGLASLAQLERIRYLKLGKIGCVKMCDDAPGPVKKGLQELNSEITCPVCQEFFQDPKILPCFHYYCKRCVLQLAAREPFPCPECRKDTLLPPTGADGFPTAFFVNRLKSAVEKIQQPFVYPAVVEGPGIEGAVTNTPTELVVHTNVQQCRMKQSMRVELKSMVDGSVEWAEVTEKEKGCYLVSYRPKVRGRYKLNLFVNQQPIAGSPYAVFAEHPPTQLGKPVRIIEGVDKPCSIALNKSGHLLVTQPEKGAVAALSKDGRVVPGGKDGLEEPFGIAIDEDGSILVTSKANQQLMKFNKDWTLAKAVEGHFGNIGRVKISPTTHKYYVCDHRHIQVFDRDLEHEFNIGKGGKYGLGEFSTDIAFDDVGNVYVVEYLGHQVEKFSPRGESQLIFGCCGRYPGELKYPDGIHISGKFAYITESRNNRVSVFTTNGEFVTTFGSRTELNDPGGIIADEDGFLYVCGFDSNKVAVY